MTDIMPEFSRRVPLDKLRPGDNAMAVEAREPERRALAERFGLRELPMLRAEVTLTKLGRGGLVRVAGHLAAEVVQTCVVTLDPVPAHIEEDFAVLFGPEEEEASDEVVVGLDEEDWPEPMVGGAVDVGEAVAEQLALALEPFPRAPGIAFEGYRIGEDEEDAERPNPFAKLADLKGRMK